MKDIPTPRTDEASNENGYYQSPIEMVPADFARTLERELIALQTICAKQKEALENCLNMSPLDPFARGKMINDTLALTPYDVSDQLAQLRKDIDLQRTLTVSEKQAKVERGDMLVEAQEQLAAKDSEIAECRREALRLAETLWRNHYKHTAPKWKPFDYTAGIISQIDNMCAGIVERAEAAEAKLSVANATIEQYRRTYESPARSTEE